MGLSSLGLGITCLRRSMTDGRTVISPKPAPSPMQTAFEICRALSAIAFLGYGVACLATQHMVAEFERFGLGRFRQFVGALEFLGGLGLLVGYFYPPLLLVASGGLTMLMLLGVWTRIRVGDSMVETLPAFLFFVLNGFVFWHAAL